MGNSNYLKGAALEREIVNTFKSVGCVSARTAGSHGKYDLYVIGTPNQLDLGWDKLELAKFRPGNEYWERTGLKYTDRLYLFAVAGPEHMALFIQCKRRLK